MSNELKEELSEDIKRGVYDINFVNANLVAQYMYEKLDKETVEALMLELEAQIRFGDK